MELILWSLACALWSTSAQAQLFRIFSNGQCLYPTTQATDVPFPFVSWKPSEPACQTVYERFSDNLNNTYSFEFRGGNHGCDVSYYIIPEDRGYMAWPCTSENRVIDNGGCNTFTIRGEPYASTIGSVAYELTNCPQNTTNALWQAHRTGINPDDPPRSTPLPTPRYTSLPQHDRNPDLGVGVGAGIGGFVVLVAIAGFIWRWTRPMKKLNGNGLQDRRVAALTGEGDVRGKEDPLPPPSYEHALQQRGEVDTLEAEAAGRGGEGLPQYVR